MPTKNVGNVDRIVRLVIAAVLIVFGVLNISSTLGIVLLVVSLIPLLTAVINFCPLYTLLGINTCSSKAVAE